MNIKSATGLENTSKWMYSDYSARYIHTQSATIILIVSHTTVPTQNKAH